MGKKAIINHRFSIPCSALAAQAATFETAAINLEDDFFMESMQIVAGYRGFTTGQGPVYFGINNGDYSVAEVAEYYTAGGPKGRTEMIEAEQVKRVVKLLGQTDMDKQHSKIQFSRGQDGLMYQKFEMTANDISGPQFHVFNDDDAALAAGTLIVAGFVRYKGEWV